MNEILKNIKRVIVDPAIQEIKSSTIGYITAIDHENQTVDVVLVEKDGMKRRRNGLSLPKNGSGLIEQTPKPGDRVEVGYRNSQYTSIYIISVYKTNKINEPLDGQLLPRSMDLF